MHNIIFLILSVLSHLGASLFFVKPRFNKAITVLIWISYGIMFLILPINTPVLNFIISFFVHLILFFITAGGRMVEKGFLFFSYSGLYTCFTTFFNIFDQKTSNEVVKIVSVVVLIAVMQVILYKMLLPSFRKFAKYVRREWIGFYFVLLSFLALIIGQSLFYIMHPIDNMEAVVFILSVLSFCVTYIVIFNSMKNIVELSHEKQKTLHTELLQAQVSAQANEAEVVRQNRHDMRHHYQELLSMAREGKIDKLIDYLKLQSSSIETMSTGRFCENETVNSVLRVYYQKATDANINIDICAAAKPSISVPSPALITIIANVLENALHGAVDSKNDSPYIKVSVKHKSGRLVLSCENTCSSLLDFEEMPEYLQGIGIHSIISTADKYNGFCRFSANSGVFKVTIIIDQ